MSCTLPKIKSDIKLNTLKCSYDHDNRLLMTIDRPFLHFLCRDYHLHDFQLIILRASLINRQSDTLIVMIME